MSSMPWIKVYTEFLDDPKIGRVSESAKFRFIQLLLIAGDCDAEGYLSGESSPLTIEDIAWRLRLENKQLQKDMGELQDNDLIELDDDCWLICNFSDRQGRSQAEKRKGWNERQRNKRARDKEKKENVSHASDESIVTEESPVTHGSRGEERREDIEGEKKSDSRTKVRTPTPSAVKVFRKKAHRYPAKSWYKKIDEVVGGDPEDLEKWGEIVFQWVGLGFNPTNVKGMLDAFEEGGIREMRKGVEQPLLKTRGEQDKDFLKSIGK